MSSKIYLLLPYLNTFQSFELEGIEFKGWWEGGQKTSNNLAKESADDKYHLQKILESFTMGAGQGLHGFTYSIQEVESPEEYEELKKRVDLAMNILRYKLFDKDERGHVKYPQTSLYIFELPEEELKARAKKFNDSEEEYIFYKGYRDFDEEIHFGWPKDKIYPPARQVGFAHIQIPDDYFLKVLESDSWNSRKLSDAEQQRIVRAVEHYNKSYAEGSGVDERNRVLSLSAGFEALLNLPEEGIQKAFRSIVVTILGDDPNLGDWTLDFYNLRSKIIHGAEVSIVPRKGLGKKKRGKTPSLYFQNSEGDAEYIRHLLIGQTVFRKCLEIILNQRSSTYVGDIASMLVSNDVHIKHIESGIKSLNDKTSVDEWYQKKIFDAYSELGRQYSAVDAEKVVKVGKEILTLLRDHLKKKKINNAALSKDIDTILKFKGDYIDLAMLYHAISNSFEKIYFGKGSQRQTAADWAIEGAIYNFIGFASHVLFIPKGK